MIKRRRIARRNKRESTGWKKSPQPCPERSILSRPADGFTAEAAAEALHAEMLALPMRLENDDPESRKLCDQPLNLSRLFSTF